MVPDTGRDDFAVLYLYRWPSLIPRLRDKIRVAQSLSHISGVSARALAWDYITTAMSFLLCASFSNDPVLRVWSTHRRMVAQYLGRLSSDAVAYGAAELGFVREASWTSERLCHREWESGRAWEMTGRRLRGCLLGMIPPIVPLLGETQEMVEPGLELGGHRRRSRDGTKRRKEG